MKKLVLKTVAITLAIILCVALIVFGALSIFTPKTMAKFFDGVGNYSASVLFYEKQYFKTESMDDLATLAVKLDYERDKDKMEKYYKILVNEKDFDKFCTDKDSENPSSVPSKAFYTSEYVLTLAKNGKLDDALDYAKKYVFHSGYTSFNPLRSIATEFAGTVKDKNTLYHIKSAISSTLYSLDEDQKDMAEQDMVGIELLIQAMDK